MAKKKLLQDYNLYFKANLEGYVIVRAESLEDALFRGKEIKTLDFLEEESVMYDDYSSEINGVYKL
jgi:hypothetical protein